MRGTSVPSRNTKNAPCGFLIKSGLWPWISPSQRTARTAKTSSKKGQEKEAECLILYCCRLPSWRLHSSSWRPLASEEDPAAAAALAAAQSRRQGDGPLQRRMLAGAALRYAGASAGQPVAMLVVAALCNGGRCPPTSRRSVRPLTSISRLHNTTECRPGSTVRGLRSTGGLPPPAISRDGDRGQSHAADQRRCLVDGPKCARKRRHW